jgi:hypothetical protein
MVPDMAAFILIISCYVHESIRLLSFFGFNDQFGEWLAQTSGNSLSRIQVWASFSALQKPNVGLMQPRLRGESRSAETFCLPATFHNSRKTI